MGKLKSPFLMGKLTFSCSNQMVIHFSPMLSRPFKSLASSGAPGQAGGEQQGFLHNLSTLHDPGLTTWDGRPMVVAKKTGTLLYISTDDIIYIYIHSIYTVSIYLSIFIYIYIHIYMESLVAQLFMTSLRDGNLTLHSCRCHSLLLIR